MEIVQHQFFTLDLIFFMNKNGSVSPAVLFVCFAALREVLFASAARLLGSKLHLASDKRKTEWLLNGVSELTFKLMQTVFHNLCNYFFLVTF